MGVIGLALWICVLVLVIRRLWTAYRTLPDHDLCGKPLAVTAIMAFATLIGTGLTVDLRFFDFPMLPIFLLAGITIGWSDRYQRSQTAAGGDIVEPVTVATWVSRGHSGCQRMLVAASQRTSGPFSRRSFGPTGTSATSRPIGTAPHGQRSRHSLAVRCCSSSS